MAFVTHSDDKFMQKRTWTCVCYTVKGPKALYKSFAVAVLVMWHVGTDIVFVENDGTIYFLILNSYLSSVLIQSFKHS